MADESPSLAPAEVYASPKRQRGFHVPILVWIALVLLAAFGGYYAGQSKAVDSASTQTLARKMSITTDELDGVVATLGYEGADLSITARDAIAQESSLDALLNDDGSYAMPSAESMLSAARTAVLMRDAEAHGIEVSDEELLAYTAATFGTDDIASLANAYTMDEEAVRERLRESCAIAKLRALVVADPGEAPAAPAAPEANEEGEQGERDSASADYAAYIISLAGDEWDAEKGAWAPGNGPYATALKDYDVRADSATYEAAQTAYNVAFQQHSDAITAATTQWTDYVNGLLCSADLKLYSIVT